MRKIFLVILLALLSCKNDIEAPDYIGFGYKNNLPVIKTTINGIGGRFLIDSGASYSIIDLSTIDYYNFKTYGNTSGSIQGIGGSKESKSVKDIEVKYYGQVLDIDFKAINIENLRNSAGVVGVIGSDYLKKNKLVIDYATQTISKSNCEWCADITSIFLIKTYIINTEWNKQHLT